MKILAKAAMVVGVAAAVIGTAGLLAPVATAGFLASAGLSLATVSAIGMAASIVAGLAMQFVPRKASLSATGSQTQFKADPQAPIPYVMGRTIHSGNIIHRDTWGTDREYQGFAVVWSGAGPVNAIESFLVDYEAVTFDISGAATGARFGFDGSKGPWMWLKTQLGTCPEPSAITCPVPGFTSWTAAHKLSGYCAGLWVLKFDKEGKKYSGGVPQPAAILQGVRVYDPRLDSTYPGGSGPCRMLDESTYVYSENGPLHGLTFALGRWQGPNAEALQRVMGVGMLPDQIDVEAYVEAANVWDANGWTLGGMVTSGDDKWAVLKSIMLSGAGEPMHHGARLSCYISAPKVSVATIEEDDLVGDVQGIHSNSRRDRINSGIPRFRSEAHSWQIVPSEAIIFDDLVAQDRGKRRTEELELPLVQDADQAAQVTAYRVLNARERGPFTVPTKPKWIGLRPGDCVTLNLPSQGLVGQKMIIRRRLLQPEDSSVRFVMVTETDDKHTRALEEVGATPPPVDFTPPEPTDGAIQNDSVIQLIIYNSYTSFLVTAGTATDVGSNVTLSIAAHDRVYSDKSVPVNDGEVTGLSFGTTYYIYYDDASRLGGEVLYESTTDYWEALNSPTNSGRHYVGWVTTPADAGAPTYMTPATPLGSYDPYYY